ncbi:MAG: phosphodiester glycosidase family protein [Erysipelothrix sp.]|jgi:exopolysaccharide biosynthesis protein|nr:phosphodiester glycosidase family protein [Erysipelothrix sp.]
MKRTILLIIFVIFSLSLSSITLYDAFLLEVTEKPIGNEIIDPNVPTDPTDPTDPIDEIPEPIVYENISTDTEYQDQDMTIRLEKIRKFGSDVYVVYVQVRNIEVVHSLFAKDTFGKNISETTSSMAKRTGAIVAINGDYYGYRFRGLIIRNGRLYLDTPRKAPDNMSMNLNINGVMSAILEGSDTGQNILQSGVYQSYSFGPVLVDNKEIQSLKSNYAAKKNPRSAIGMIEPFHYIFLAADGRTAQSPGLTMKELAQTFVDLGATFAYNLDGGGSSALWFNGRIVNKPTFDGTKFGERTVSDVLTLTPITRDDND